MHKRYRYITLLNVFTLVIFLFMALIAVHRDAEGWWVMSEFILLLFVLLPVTLANVIIGYKVHDTRKKLIYHAAVIAVYALLVLYACFF